MKILDRYLIRDYLIIFGMTLAVFTFVLYLGALIKAVDLVARGVSGSVIMKIFLLNVPYILSFSLPMSSLTAVLLMFGRLSIDGEMTAMRACGVSVWQIVAPVILVSMLFTGVCFYINYEAAPRSHFARRQALVNLGDIDPVNLLEEGRFVNDFPGLKIYIGSKSRHKIKNVEVFEMDGTTERRYIRANSGTIITDKEKMSLDVILYDVDIREPDPKDPTDLAKARIIQSESYRFDLNYEQMLKNKNITKKLKDLRFTELMISLSDAQAFYPELKGEKLQRKHTKSLVEAHKRVALSFACFGFTLLGIPLGMSSKRKESSAGIGISLALVFIFYFFIIMAESLSKYPEYKPDLIVWIPVIASQLLGFFMIRKMAN